MTESKNSPNRNDPNQTMMTKDILSGTEEDCRLSEFEDDLDDAKYANKTVVSMSFDDTLYSTDSIYLNNVKIYPMAEIDNLPEHSVWVPHFVKTTYTSGLPSFKISPRVSKWCKEQFQGSWSAKFFWCNIHFKSGRRPFHCEIPVMTFSCAEDLEKFKVTFDGNRRKIEKSTEFSRHV
jgi:hypothetical protein